MKRLMVLVVMAAAVLWMPVSAKCEPYVAFYLSGVPRWPTDVKTERIFLATGTGDRFRIKDVKTGSSVVFGGTLGYRLGPIPWLAGELDIYHLRPGIVSQSKTAKSGTAGDIPITIRDGKANTTLFGFSAVASHRILPSDRVPKGRLQGYLGVGFAISLNEVGVTFISPNATVKISDSDVDVGPQVKLGGRWFFTPNLAAFVEYRYTRISVGVADSGVSNAAAPIRIRTNMDPNINLGLIGVSWHFSP